MPEFLILLGVLCSFFIEPFENLLGEYIANLLNESTVLHVLSAQIQWNVFTVHNSFNESQVIWKNVLCFGLNKNFLAEEIDATFHPAHSPFLRVMMTHVEQSSYVNGRIGRIVKMEERIIVCMRCSLPSVTFLIANNSYL